VIDIDGLHLGLDGTDVLTGIDLTVERGELVGLVGPNGAGKTTLLGAINGLLEPDRGGVRVDGDRVGELDAKALARRVATVPQDTHLGFAFTVEQIVEMGRTPHRSRLDWSAAADAVDRALVRAEVDHLRTRTIDELSGGERQRVLLARALAQGAPILALDEPTASLDVNHQIQVLELLRRLIDDGRTAVAAIHDLDLAARYCDRLALLHDGRLQRVGPPRTVLESATLETAFGTATAITEDAVTATPRVTAVGDRPDRGSHVHVVGRGRSAARALGDCWAAGFDVSIGVVPDGDVAASLAADLDARAVTAEPFGDVEHDHRQRTASLLETADVVVRTAADPDPINRELLEPVESVVRWPGAAEVLDPGETEEGVAPSIEPERPTPTERPVVRAVVAELPPGAATDD
jgi:iron complex transport system ATP-binding protein